MVCQNACSPGITWSKPGSEEILRYPYCCDRASLTYFGLTTWVQYLRANTELLKFGHMTQMIHASGSWNDTSLKKKNKADNF